MNARYHFVHDWGVLFEVRQFTVLDAETTEQGLFAAVYKQVGHGMQIGVGYNFGSCSDDLTDLTNDGGHGVIDIVASF